MIVLHSENNEQAIEWKKDPINDIDLFQILKFELPRAGNYHQGLLDIKYFWDEGRREIKYVLLVIKCSDCNKTTKLQIDRKTIISKRSDNSVKCHKIYCNDCRFEGKFDKRFFINRNLNRVTYKNYQIKETVEQENLNLINTIPEIFTRTSSHVYDSKELEEKEHKAEPVRIYRKNINDIKILRFVDSLKQQNIQWCTISYLVKNMVIIKSYLNQSIQQVERESFSLYLREIISDLIDKKMVRQKNPRDSPRYPSAFKLTKTGRFYIQKWRLIKEIIESENALGLIQDLISQKFPNNIITHKNILHFFQAFRSSIKWISLDFIKKNMSLVKKYYKKENKIRAEIRNFPEEKYFSESYDKNKLGNTMKIELERKLETILLEGISQLKKKKYLKRRKGEYKLTWKGELYQAF